MVKTLAAYNPEIHIARGPGDAGSIGVCLENSEDSKCKGGYLNVDESNGDVYFFFNDKGHCVASECKDKEICWNTPNPIAKVNVLKVESA